MSANRDQVVRRGPKAERREATRGALLRAARDLFSERGYAAVGTNEIVERAGVTRGALYHHFRDKRELFEALYEQMEAELVASIGAEMSEAGDPVDFLVVGIRRFLDLCTD